MHTSAVELVRVMASLEQLMSLALSDEQKVDILEDIQKSIPPHQFCTNSIKTRAILVIKIQENIDGLKTKKATSEKPKQSRARKTPTKSTKA